MKPGHSAVQPAGLDAASGGAKGWRLLPPARLPYLEVDGRALQIDGAHLAAAGLQLVGGAAAARAGSGRERRRRPRTPDTLPGRAAQLQQPRNVRGGHWLQAYAGGSVDKRWAARGSTA